MNSTMNERIIYYKSFNKNQKEIYIKHYIEQNTIAYNKYKSILKQYKERYINEEKHIKFYDFRMKNHMSQVLLYNSILKKNKENIIKNFNDFNKHQLDYMEIMEEKTEDENIMFISNIDDEKTKPSEKYRLICIEVKELYELLKYIIEDYNNIKL